MQGSGGRYRGGGMGQKRVDREEVGLGGKWIKPGKGGSFYYSRAFQILNSFLGLIHLYRSTQICTSNITGAGLS